MKSFTLFATLSTFLLSAVLAAPAASSGVTIETTGGQKTGRHIVILKAGTTRSGVLSKVASVRGGKPGDGVTHTYDALFTGFAGEFDKLKIQELN